MPRFGLETSFPIHSTPVSITTSGPNCSLGLFSFGASLWIWVLVYVQIPFLLCSAMHWNILSIMFDPGLLFLVSCHGGYLYLLASAHSWLVLCVRPTPNFFQGFLFWRWVTNWTEVSCTNTWFAFPSKYLRFCEAIFSRYFIVIQGIWGFLSLFLWMLYDCKLSWWIGFHALLIGKLRILSG